jgi:hypothetical protein
LYIAFCLICSWKVYRKEALIPALLKADNMQLSCYPLIEFHGDPLLFVWQVNGSCTVYF